MKATATACLWTLLLAFAACRNPAEGTLRDIIAPADLAGSDRPDPGPDAVLDDGPDTSGPCPTDYMAADGTACDREGRQCGGDCTDPCRFCNLLRCEGGHWNWMEIFPDPNCGDVPGDEVPGADVPGADVPGADVPVGDVPLDADALPDVPAPDPGVDAGCQPVACDLFCPFGFRRDGRGCEVCSCRECGTGEDCRSSLRCANPSCSASGDCTCDCTEGEGSRTYACPDGTEVPWCACGPLGVGCIDHPEHLCPTLCHPGQADPWICADGSTLPWCECVAPACGVRCDGIGGADEGWYDKCSGLIVKKAACAGCGVACANIGTRSEAWMDGCTGERIDWAKCAPARTCADPPTTCPGGGKCVIGQSVDYACPDGDTRVRWCSCDVPAAACMPGCRNVGTPDEGWYDGCTGVLVRQEKCSGCTVTCDKVGSKGEGWYSSCSGLLGWSACATGDWTCPGTPWDSCAVPVPCTPEGQGYTLPSPWGTCCPGLVEIDAASWDGSTCAWPNCLCKACTWCGDGRCVPPENPCNCPGDCPREAPRKAMGQPCGRNPNECEDGLECLGGIETGGLYGVCSKVCNPASAGPAAPCGTDGTCAPYPWSQAPGFCMLPCDRTSDCPEPLTCGGWRGVGLDPPAYGCWPWGPCEPLFDSGCVPGAPQCHVAAGQPVCGEAGTLAPGDKCDAARDLCGPGLVCGSISRCWPACQEDAQCQPSYDFCLKRVAGSPWGHCMILE